MGRNLKFLSLVFLALSNASYAGPDDDAKKLTQKRIEETKKKKEEFDTCVKNHPKDQQACESLRKIWVEALKAVR